MPTYEMPLLLRTMSRPEIVTTLKRVAKVVFNTGGFLRGIDNLGLQQTPYKMKAHGAIHHEANYFILHFDAPPRSLLDMNEEYSRDIDIVRNRIYNKNDGTQVPCTLHEEMLPAPYRPSVRKLVDLARRQDKRKMYQFKSNSGLGYYPFSR